MAIVAQHIGHTMHNEIPLQWASCENGRGWYMDKFPPSDIRPTRPT